MLPLPWQVHCRAGGRGRMLEFTGDVRLGTCEGLDIDRVSSVSWSPTLGRKPESETKAVAFP